ncbi:MULTISPECIES: SDR family NAD(P)-dependent oxidoreductase [unclassified Phenylobacterium]|jgi:glucose 1-dehydrogenase|uniref:SDR family NAD(P)-dependent oxidoreductase n=3 Tax=Phenylobacterium TaxID=20 RepID=UPI00083A4134|nr:MULTISPECIES: glucose 1-dehydrogenase [unclassified Phenylobacterium]
MRFADKVVIVTGSTSGIGLATAAAFAAEGAQVTLVGRGREKGQAAQSAVEARAQDGGGAMFVPADLSRPEEARRVVSATLERHRRVDVLVNNAAMMTFAPILDLPEADWDRVIAVNLKAAFLLAQAAAPHMPPGGSIVNVSSVHAQATGPLVVPYAASKGGLEAFTRGLAMELDSRQIRVNAVRPGAVDTPMLWENPNVKSGLEAVDRAEVGAPEQIAAAILFLASNEAGFVNGAVLSADGGRLAQLGGAKRA